MKRYRVGAIESTSEHQRARCIEPIDSRTLETKVDTWMLRRRARRPANLDRFLSAVLIALVASGTLGSASAENGTFAPLESPDPVASALAVNLTPAQMRATAAQFVVQMDQVTLSLRRQLEQSRERRDVVKVLCLDDKLKQADIVTGSVRGRIQSLDDAVKHEDAERARHEFTVVQALHERMRIVSTEAIQCVGEELGLIDDAKVVVQIDPTVPSIDPTKVPFDPVVSVPPAISSPTR